ncbi:hypothetical protein TGMAS_274040 [Toxoplasma gondii MAS]|uniref:Uncharacterized protein n=1 Tax=Toxoplasma gondii MAS TaxID=943118 RepID=A0A086QX19_TOXGO|nr:hypothetical protein TGMAS_274040 [Toxoplasma gondii MAS]
MQELLATEVDVYLSEYEQEPAQDNVVSADDEERRMKAAVAKRIHAVKVIEECLVTAEQNSFCSDFIEECAVSMWNMARPLLLAPSRSLVYRSLHRPIEVVQAWNLSYSLLGACFIQHKGHMNRMFAASTSILFEQASEALENIESSLATLRVNLLYQVALCEAEEDLPAVAKESIEKALSIDFSNPSESRTLSASVVSGTSAHQGDNLNLREPTQSPESRCLDRYLKTLLESIKPQVVLDDEFVILDQMQLLVDRSKSALSLRNYLPKIEALKDQALAELAESEKETATPLHDPVEAEVNQTGREAKLDRLLRLMNNVAQHAYAYGQFSVAATFCKTVLRLTENRRDELSPILQDDEEEKTPAERNGDSAPPAVRLMVPAHHKQTAIAVVQSCYTLALCLSHILKMEFKELPGVDTSNGKVERISTDSDEFPVSTATRLAGQKKGTAKAMKMKQDIVQLLLVGSRLSKDFEQFWLISNGAIHFWNLHKHILESRAFDRTRSVSLLEHVQELQTHLLVKHEVFPASSNLAVTEEAISRALPFLGRSGCKDIVASLFEGGTAACTNSTWIEQLLKANVNNDPPIAPAPSPSKAGKSAKQQATSPAVLAELPSDLMGGEIRALILMERISKETDIPTKESLITRCYDIIQAMPVGTEATRDLQAEMKVRLAVRAFSSHTLFLRLSLAFALEAVGEDRQHVPYSLSATISRRKRLWLGISHTVAGLSLSSIHSDRSCPNASSGQALALLHLLQACQCAQSTQNASLALFACQSLWNVAAPLLPVAELRRDLINAIRAALPIVGVARRSEALPTLAKLYLGLLSCLSAEGEWRDVIAVADKAFLQLPKSVHSQVLRFQLLAISQSEKKPFAEISEKATSESASEGDLLLFCARALPVGHSDAVKLYERAIEIMEGSSDLKAADAHLELADLFLLSSEPWSQVSKHIKVALALADDADDMQRRCSFLKTFRGDKGSSSDAKETTYIPELGFDIHQRAKTLTLLATPDADEFLAALSDASTAVPLAGNAFAGKVLDIRDMAKPLQVQGEQPLPKHPVTAPASSSDFEDSRLFHNSREHRRFENYSLAVEACRTLQNVLFQLGLEAWSIPVLHRHLELLRAAGSEPGWVFNREFLHLEQTLCSMRLARAFHICEGATGKQTVLMSMSSVVDSTLDALSKFLPSLLARSCDLAHVPGAGLEAEAASTFYVQQFQQAAAAKLFVDLAEEFYFWGESRAAFEFAIAALQKALTAEATETEVVIRAAGCVGALQTGEGRDSPACVFLKAVLHAEGGGASATTLAAVAETLILARPRSEKSEMLDELLTGVIHALEELDRRCRTKDFHRAGAKRLRPNDIPSFDRGLLHGDSTMSTKFSAETLLIKEELPSRPVLHSLWKARLQLLRLDRSAADLGDRLRVATPAGVLDRLTAVVSDVQTVVDSLLSSPLLIFILPRLVPLFVNLCDLVENLHQEPDRVGSIPEEGVCTQRQTASSQTEATSPAIYNQERDELIARLRRMAAIIGDRITLPSLRQDIRLCPPDMLSSLHRSVSFFGVIRARLERLSCCTQLLDPAAPDVSACLLPLESMSFPGMVEFLTASRERRAVDEWLRKTARQSGHREGNVKDARRLLGEALDSLANLGTLPYQTLKAEADREIVEFRRQVLRSLRGGVGLASVFSLNETEISFLSEVALLNLHIAHAAQELLHLEKAGETETEFVGSTGTHALMLQSGNLLAALERVGSSFRDTRSISP